MRALHLAMAFLMLACSSVFAQGLTFENNVNRAGSDYRNFDLPQASPQMCSNACAGESACQAYTYVKPGVQGPQAKCWLKSSVPAASANECCVSGVKAAVAPPAGSVTVEDGVNRPGGDYRSFDLSQAIPDLCRAACAGDSVCKSYTYVRPGVQGPNAKCWLKNTVPPAVAGGGCCVSGVKPDAGPVVPPALPPQTAGGHWRLEGQPELRNTQPPTQPPSYHIDSFEANSRGGQIRVTTFAAPGECAPGAGMVGPGTSQSFTFRWTFNPDAGAMRVDDRVAVTYWAQGSVNACMQQNPFMMIGAPQRNLRTSDSRHRFYTFSGPTDNVGGDRLVSPNGSQLGPRDEFEIVINGFRVPLALYIKYRYVWVP